MWTQTSAVVLSTTVRMPTARTYRRELGGSVLVEGGSRADDHPKDKCVVTFASLA